jgi:triosephosphate isomerase (TIM)
MRRPVVAGNWKMHGTRAENATLLRDVVAGLPESPVAEVIVCPPFVYLWETARALKESDVKLGAQSVCAETGGAFTGEISATMLKDVGCSHVLVGHSERRALYHETDAVAARKFLAAQAHGLIPILCVGETLEEHERGDTMPIVRRQIFAVLDVAGPLAFERSLIAYEPVWAIGTGKNATPDQAQEVHAQIRAAIAERDGNIAAAVRILYGGSVKASNARGLLSMPDVDGGLVGGASLKADEFLKICAAAQSH